MDSKKDGNKFADAMENMAIAVQAKEPTKELMAMYFAAFESFSIELDSYISVRVNCL